jgi:hypothetical protein
LWALVPSPATYHSSSQGCNCHMRSTTHLTFSFLATQQLADTS